MQINRVLIVEDDVVIRSCLVEDINAAPGFSVVGEVGSIAQAKLFSTASYQIVLLDLNLTDGHGLELLNYLNKKLYCPKVLILSALGDQQSVLQAIEEGADGYLLKDATPSEIIRGLQNVMAGESVASPTVTKVLMNNLRSSRAASDPKPQLEPVQPSRLLNTLSPRELDVLKLLALGKSYKQMALDLGVTYNTVSHYVKQLYNKLEVGSKNEAIYKAVSDGIISI